MKLTHWPLAASSAIALLFASSLTAKEEGSWIDLFDGKSLEGWTQKNGTATYRIEGETIVGRTSAGSPNSFLCTDAEYSDFELEFEVKVDPQLNSGVQIRSKAEETTEGSEVTYGRVNGPQVEIEGTGDDGAESGYIYGEGTPRGWLTPVDRLKPHRLLKDGEWNKYRVVAKGPRIQTWINGEPIEDLTDDPIYESHPKGFIGLQVHGIRRNEGPYEVAWRNIRLRPLD